MGQEAVAKNAVHAIAELSTHAGAAAAFKQVS
jgi:hypothetical protein